MGWLERHYKPSDSSADPQSQTQGSSQSAGLERPGQYEPDMTPGLEGDYDPQRRMMAGLHEPPIPPEYMGLDGEFDEQGLTKRVLQVFDQNPDLPDIETLTVEQQGDAILLHGTVPSREMLEQLQALAASVDGVRHVNLDDVHLGEVECNL